MTDNIDATSQEKLDCQQHRRDAVTSFRLGMYAQGSEALKQYIDCQLWHWVKTNKVESLTQHDTLLVNAILAAQQRDDYAYIADLLEYEIPQSNLVKNAE